MTTKRIEGSGDCNDSDSTDDGQTRRQYLRSVGLTGAGLAFAGTMKATPPKTGYVLDDDYYRYEDTLSGWPSTRLETGYIDYFLGEHDVSDPFDVDVRGWGPDNRVLVTARGRSDNVLSEPGFLLDPKNAEAVAFRLLETAQWVRTHTEGDR